MHWDFRILGALDFRIFRTFAFLDVWIKIFGALGF